jgi:hypothetical protein
MPEGFHKPMLGQLSHNDTPSDHRQIGGERTAASKIPQRRHIPLQQFGKRLRAQIFGVISGQFQAVRVGCLTNHLKDQAGESIHEDLPATTMPGKQIIE